MYKIILYKDAKGENRWRITETNGNIVATNHEGIENKSVMVKGLENLLLAIKHKKYTISTNNELVKKAKVIEPKIVEPKIVEPKIVEPKVSDTIKISPK